MIAVLRYGTDSSVELDFPEGGLLADCGRPNAPVCDPSDATAQALAAPIDYPLLAESILPSDHVVVALESGVPQAAAIVGAVVRKLIDLGVAPDGITVLRTQTDADLGLGDPAAWLDAEVRRRIRLVTHDPSVRHTMAYLAATEAGEPVLLNRALTDADVVLPIGCIQAHAPGSFRRVASHVYPNFSDDRTIRRFRAVEPRAGQAAQRKALAAEVRQVNWLLGLMFTVQVVPGPGDGVLHVLAGEMAAVYRQARSLYEAAWRCSVPHRAQLVVAAIEGDASQQTWHNVGRAVAAAGAMVEDGGAVVVCCDLATAAGPALQQLASAATQQEALRQIRKERPVDALPAAQLAQVLDRVKLYLLSRLDETLLEDLEIAPITDPEDLVRLVHHYESCILLSNAPRLMVHK